MKAALSGHHRVVETLLNHRACVDARSASGKTALVYASGKGFIESVELLLLAKARVDIRDKTDYSALEWARGSESKAHKSCLALLLEAQRQAL